MSEDLTRAELAAQAEALGIDVAIRWGKDRIRQAIDEHTAEPESAHVKPEPTPEQPAASSETYRNVSRVKQCLFGHMIAPGGTYTLHPRDYADERGGRKLARALSFGHVEKA